MTGREQQLLHLLDDPKSKASSYINNFIVLQPSPNAQLRKSSWRRPRPIRKEWQRLQNRSPRNLMPLKSAMVPVSSLTSLRRAPTPTTPTSTGFEMFGGSRSKETSILLTRRGSTRTSTYMTRTSRWLGSRCDAGSSSSCFTGYPIDDRRRSDPNWQNDRQCLADCIISFGSNASSRKGGQIYLVTGSSDHDLANPTPGTLRHAVIQMEPLWIMFSRDTPRRRKNCLRNLEYWHWPAGADCVLTDGRSYKNAATQQLVTTHGLDES